jgi:hypothetical protein
MPPFGIAQRADCTRGQVYLRWAGLFAGLAPTISLSDMPPSNRPELRLVVGPLVSADAAAKLCTTLRRYRLACQPTIFAGRRLALD